MFDESCKCNSCRLEKDGSFEGRDALLSGYFFNFAYLAFYFSRNLLFHASLFQIRVVCNSAGGFFHLAFDFMSTAFDFIFQATFHNVI